MHVYTYMDPNSEVTPMPPMTRAALNAKAKGLDSNMSGSEFYLSSENTMRNMNLEHWRRRRTPKLSK